MSNKVTIAHIGAGKQTSEIEVLTKKLDAAVGKITQLTKEIAELTEENGRLRAENEQWRELDSRNRGYSFDDTEQ